MASRRKQSNPRSFKDVDEPDIAVGSQGESCKVNDELEKTEKTNIEVSEDCSSPAPFSGDGGEVNSDPESMAATPNGQTEKPSLSPVPYAGSDSEDSTSDTPKSSSQLSSGTGSKEFPYPCSYCEKAFSKFSYVKDHELIHSDEMPYQCEFCQREFRHKRSRDRHMKLHTGDRNYKCTLCNAAFSRSDHLKNHIKSHGNGKWFPGAHRKSEELPGNADFSEKQPNVSLPVKNSPGVHSCQLCGALFSNLYDLDEHLKGHAHGVPASADGNHSSKSSSFGLALPGKPLEYHCTHCAKQSLKQVFASLLALEQHVTHMHSGKGLSLLSCPHCEAAFPTVPTLNHHIEQEHSQGSTISTTAIADSYLSTSWTQSKTSSVTTPSRIKSTTSSIAENLPTESISGNGKVSTPSNSMVNQESLKCYICKKVFSSAADVMSHIFTKHTPQTPRTTSTSSAVDTDVREASTPLDLSSRSPPSPVSCQVCGESFTSFTLLMEHTQTLHWELMRSKCSVCSEIVSSPQQQLDHMERHYLSTRRLYICRCCKKTFSLVDDLQAHLITEHSRKIYKCLVCADVLHTEIDLKIHLTMEHSNENKAYKCACCGHPFDDVSSWRTHMLQMHMDLVLPSSTLSHVKKEQFQCPYCIMTFRAESELKLHVLTHQRSFQCSLCGEGFAVEYLLDKHIQKEHSRQLHTESHSQSSNQAVTNDIVAPFQCAICDRVFHSEEVYEEHKRKSHSSAKPWQCRTIEKHSSNSSSSSSTSVVQTKVFSTACSTCGKAFKTYSELDKHSRVHFGPVSLTCVICDEVCSSLADMAKHKLQHCKVPSTKPCILCQVEINTIDEYLKHSHLHVEADSTVVCCVCKHRVTSQVELDLHAEFHFPKKSPLSCASCNKVCPYFIPLPAQLTDNPQFLLCQECLIARKQSTSILLPHRLLPPPPGAPDCKSPRSPSLLHTALSPAAKGLTRDQKVSVSSQLGALSPVHRCSECNSKFASMDELDNHACMQKQCFNCQKTYRISELVCKLDSYICVSCDSITKDLWKCDKCKLTFTREEKYQKHNCIALGDGKICSLCQGRFNHSQLLLKGSKLVCKSCDKKVKTCHACSESYLQNDGHVCKVKCSSCGEMLNMMPSQLSGKEAVLCQLCISQSKNDSVFESANNKSPPNVSGNSGKIYQCIQCPKSCESENEIKIHILTSHMNEKSHKCYLCSALFLTSGKLQAHLVAHNFMFSNRMTCPKCEYTTSDAATLLNHCTSEHSITNRSYVCAYCLQSFFFETELVNHSSAHHGGLTSMYRPSPSPASTELAGRKRPQSAAHYDANKFVPKTKVVKSEALSDNEDHGELFCSKCDVEFASLDQYSNHLNLHHQESIRSCPWCSKLYCCQDDLKEHFTSCRLREKRRPSDEVFSNGLATSTDNATSTSSGRERNIVNKSFSFHSIKEHLSKSPQTVLHSLQTNSSYKERSDVNADASSAVSKYFNGDSLVISTTS